MKYLYKIHFGLSEHGEIIRNWSSKTVIACDAQKAINKARLSKKYFVESVEQIERVDVQ